MSLNLFGRKKAAPARTEDKRPVTANVAVDDVKDTLEMLEKREAHVRRLVDKEVADARAHHAAGRQREALECMKRKRIHEKELEPLANKKLNLVTAEATLQSLKFNEMVMGTEEKLAAAIDRQIKKAGGVDGVARLAERMEDVFADAKDVLEEAARPIGEQYEDEELLEELEQMELAAELQSVVNVSDGVGESSSKPTVEPLPVPRGQVGVGSSSAADARAAREEREAARELAELTALRSSMVMEAPMAQPMRAAPVEEFVAPMPMMHQPMMATCC